MRRERFKGDEKSGKIGHLYLMILDTHENNKIVFILFCKRQDYFSSLIILQRLLIEYNNDFNLYTNCVLDFVKQ